MARALQHLFSDADLERIRAATSAAEERTSGEIVPYLVERIGDHPEVRYKGATFGALTASAAAGVLHGAAGIWGGAGITWIAVPTLIGLFCGWWLAAVPALGRRLITREDMDRRVRLRAEAAFLEEEVFRTRDRTGILIFLAVWEHRAVILGDEGIHRAVPEGAWQQLVDDLVSGIAAGRATEALVDVIGRCGDLLELRGLGRQPDDEDELSDAPRLRES